ncbi:hypothetical protein OIU78_015407 [Salix suchowensis]|nr:hypothetical protein OIU78_015407 [Salix suchowensis]
MKSFGDAAATGNNQDSLMQQQRQLMQVKDDDNLGVRYDLIANAATYGFENPVKACFSYGGPPYSYNPNITYATELVPKGWSSRHRSCHCNHFLQNTSTDYSTPRINLIIYAINGEFVAWLKLLI